jgi:hypothetical protein
MSHDSHGADTAALLSVVHVVDLSLSNLTVVFDLSRSLSQI